MSKLDGDYGDWGDWGDSVSNFVELIMRLIAIENGLPVEQPVASYVPLLGHAERLLPPVVGSLNRHLWAWGQAGLSPGPLVAERVWLGPEGALGVAFASHEKPKPALQVGIAPDLAAWLVLLDKWMETFVVIARARAVWGPGDLAGALTFVAPAFLPRRLVRQPPDNWVRVAEALAQAVADGPLAGDSQDRHWWGER
jgi:hypothetical protein